MAGHPPVEERRVRPASRQLRKRPGYGALIAAAVTGTISVAALGLMASSVSASELLRLGVDDANPAKLFGASGKSVDFKLEIEGPRAHDLQVEAVRSGGGVYRRWILEDVAPGDRQVISWNGRRERHPVPNGEYFFRVRDERGRKADRAHSKGDRRFGVYDHRFPVRGRHSYGDGVGAGRGHMGQDVFARCGTKLRAARGGKVEVVDRQRGGAGHYLVIDGRGTRLDYVYMHLSRQPPVREGTRVKTGERIGRVGRSGNASGCHLHFELWSAPGWFTGGRHLRSVTAKLRKWDRWS
ncbi:MAG TPA: M23 family metallopeptidase [Solirubrobacterales bacterium]|nr:M23 family metallopeptidase [Solirubrobacterales bacterium]